MSKELSNKTDIQYDLIEYRLQEKWDKFRGNDFRKQNQDFNGRPGDNMIQKSNQHGKSSIVKNLDKLQTYKNHENVDLHKEVSLRNPWDVNYPLGRIVWQQNQQDDNQINKLKEYHNFVNFMQMSVFEN